jgi:hypothetical protein
MARITHFVERSLDRVSLHDGIEAKFHVSDVEGRRILQIWITGREGREFPGKTSQTIQLTAESGTQLLTILQRTFGRG